MQNKYFTISTTDKVPLWFKLIVAGLIIAAIVVLFNQCPRSTNPAIANTKSAKAKTEAQIEQKDAERVEITTEQVAKNDSHISDTKKDMVAIDRILHRQPIKDAEYDSMYNVVKNARP